MLLVVFAAGTFTVKAQTDGPNDEIPLQLTTIVQLIGSPADSVTVFLNDYHYTVLSAKPPRTIYKAELDKQVELMLKNDDNQRLSMVSAKMPDSYIPAIYQIINALQLTAKDEAASPGYKVFKSAEYTLQLNPAYKPGFLLFFISKRTR